MGIGESLKDLRKSKNLTQYDLSRKLNIGQATIACYESGLREPHINILIAYANFFECSIDYLIGREDDFGNITIKNSPAETISAEDKTLLDYFHNLSRAEKAQVTEYTRYLSERGENIRKNKNA